MKLSKHSAQKSKLFFVSENVVDEKTRHVQSLSLVLLLFLGQSVLGLSDFKLSTT